MALEVGREGSGFSFCLPVYGVRDSASYPQVTLSHPLEDMVPSTTTGD